MTLINRSVVAVAYDGLCSFEFGVAMELFGLRRPELDVDWYDLEIVSADPGPLSILGGATLSASNDLTPIFSAGTIVLPGWRDPSERPPADLIEAVVAAHSRGARIFSICSGVFVLAATGLLDKASATTHWRYVDQLARMYPDIEVLPDVLYVDNGLTLTSAGSAAGIDLGLHLIRRDYGAAIANTVARRFVVPPHRDGGQAQFIDNPIMESESSALGGVSEWVRHHLSEPISIEALARRAGMTPRTFARKFRSEMGTTPHRWLTRLRVTRAQELLETGNASIDEVAARAGFATATNLRHHFHRAIKTSPARYRAQFRRDT